MSFDFKNDKPIYLQLIEHIKMQIISGKYQPMQKIPSVRELSVQYEVNPNTIQKALFELENMGLIFTERTNGKFVTNDLDIINNIKNSTISVMIDDFYKSMEDIGLNKSQVLEILNKEK